MNGRYTYLMSQADFTAVQPAISAIAVSGSMFTVGSTHTITATVNDAQNVYLNYRAQEYAPFTEVEMFDDGNHNDGAANDYVYGADISLTAVATQYYIYAENSTIGRFSPARAQHEFYTITATGGIVPGNIVINEFVASNDTGTVDQDGEHDDWIELHNNASTPQDISGYKLSDDATNFGLFTFPTGTVLPANGYLVVWADKNLTQTGYHADFKLSTGGETIYLSNTASVLIDSVGFGTQVNDVSLGRYPNGTGPFPVTSSHVFYRKQLQPKQCHWQNC